ncbi:MAG: hypothetical protein ACKO5K_15110 [Armatimonadota bacterium]
MKMQKMVVRLALAGIGLAVVAGTANAQGWSGAQAGKIRVKAGQSSNFSENPILDDIMQLAFKSSEQVAMEIGFGSNPSTWYDLIGLRGIWRVDASTGNTVGSGVVLGSLVQGIGEDDTEWGLQDNGYTAGTGGFGANAPWIRLAGNSVMSFYGKGGLTDYTQGAFGFENVPAGSVLGIDYLIGKGEGQSDTGRVYFTETGGNNTGGGSEGDPVPEPGEWAAMGILGAGLVGLVARGRRRR